MVDASAAAGAAKWIGAALIAEAKYLCGAEDNVRSLEKDLKCMERLLKNVDANPHLTHEDEQLCDFVQEIRELVFCAEDVIDSYIVDVATKIKRKRKSRFLKCACLAAHSYPIHMFIMKIEAIQQDKKNTEERFKNILEKIAGNTRSSSSSRRIPPAENYIHLDDEVFVGIKDDITDLAKRLVGVEDDFRVLGIVGTCGAGKTTLASKLYNHTLVKSRFTHKAFVSISQKWSKIDVLQRIFKEIKEVEKGGEIPSSELELVRELYGFLQDKRCLIVLDDMWKTEAWDDVYPILPLSNKGCRVVITTRNDAVPSYTNTKRIIHNPKPLTVEQQWELFSKIAMEGRADIQKNVKFENLGRQMLDKCEGLPLAVVTLAGVLQTKQEWYQWEGVSNAYANYILKGKGKPNYGVVEDMLELSYLDLPSYLKPCLLYFAMFNNDLTFYPENIIGRWIAEGFVTYELQMKKETLQDIGMQLLEELARRYLLQGTIRGIQGQITSFRVHGLMQEFCISKAKEYQFVGPVSSESISRQPRRTTVLHSESYPEENHHLRTLFNIGDEGVELSNEARENFKSIPNKFKLLRVLYIRGLGYVALPEQIGKLVHLRHLTIARSKIFVLSKSIRNLRNLLYLFYQTRDPKEVVEVPDSLVRNMENLRELVLPKSLKRGSINRLGLNGPKNLQRLSVGAGKWMKKELPTLSTTVHSLEIWNILKEEEMEALYHCSCICREVGLRRLRLTCDRSMSSEEALEFDLEKLRACETLWELALDCPLASNCDGTNIQFPPNLGSLSLFRSAIKGGDDLMRVLGELPKLEELNLCQESFLGTQLSCTKNAFQQLQVLYLGGLVNLEEWTMDEGAMAHLRNLWIGGCPKLNRLPKSMKSITTLKELKITRMPEEFCRKIGNGAEDYYIIERIPTVIFRVAS